MSSLKPRSRTVKWLLRLAAFGFALLLAVLVLLLFPGVRYLRLAADDDVLTRADALRLRAPPKPAPEVTAASDGGSGSEKSTTTCVEGMVMDGLTPATGVGVTAAPFRWGDCACPQCVCGEIAETARLGVVIEREVGSSTNAQGQFRLCGLPVDETVSVWAEGAENATAQMNVALPTAQPITLHLQRVRGTLSGRVVDVRGKAIPTAQLLVVDGVGGTPQTVHCDERGAWRVEVPRGSVSMVVQAAGYLPETFTVLADDKAMLIVLNEAVAVTVHVLDDGVPVEGAQVTTRRGKTTHVTDAQGLAQFTAVAPDELFTATKDNKINWRRFKEAPDARRPVHLGIQLREGFIITGSVTQDGQPTADAGVTITADDTDEIVFSGVTDAAGGFRSGPLRPWDYQLVATYRGCKARKTAHVLASDTSASLDVACQEGLAGRVVTRQGRALSYAKVSASCSDGEHTATTDEQGTFDLQTERGVCALTVRDRRVQVKRERVSAPRRDVLLVTDEGATVSGRVVDAAGKPAARSPVICVNALFSQAIVDVTSKQGNTVLVSETDDQGEFRFGGVPAGQYVVVARASRFHAPAFAVGKQVTVNPEDHVETGTLVLEAGRTIEGTVTDTAGSPLSGARVAIAEDDTLVEAAQIVAAASMGDYAGALSNVAKSSASDAHGKFTVNNAQHVRVLRFTADGYEPKTVAVRAPATLSVQLERVPSVTVRGRVLSGKRPVQAFSIDNVWHFDPNGQFERELLRPAPGASMSMEIWTERHRVKTVTFTPASATIDLGDIELEVFGKILTVTVRDEKDKPVRGAMVWPVSTGGDDETPRETNDLGVAEIRHSAPIAVIKTLAKGYATQTVDLPKDAETATVVMQGLTGHIEGVATDLDGRPAAGGVVSMGELRAIVDDSGHFAIDRLDAAGPLRAVLQTPRATFGREVDGHAGQVELGLTSGGATLELTIQDVGPVLLERGPMPMSSADALVSGDSFPRDEDFVWSPSLPAGTYRFTGLKPGSWTISHLPVSERGLAALIAHAQPPSVHVVLHLAETTRVRLE